MSTKYPLDKQSGYILLMSLILLILLTILAVSAVALNTSQTRIAANATDSEISFEKAEGALNEAQSLLVNGTYSASNFVPNNNGLYLFDATAAPKWTTLNWNSSAVINSFQGYSGSQASYIIEQLPSVVKPGQNMSIPTQVYRVTARAVGVNGNSSVILQSTVQLQQ
jgi:type IV pilus assembly protein PilX